MFCCTITGNLGRDPELVQEPYERVKISLAVTVGYGENKKTIWVGAEMPHKRGQYLLGAKKGHRVTAVVEVTGYNTREGGVTLWGKLVDFSTHGSVTQAPAPAPAPVLSFDDEMPF
jgi:hypothetical protein